MFNVVVRKQIHGCFAAASTRDKYVERVLSLPFAPFVGLHLRNGDWSAVLCEVSWQDGNQKFVAYTEPDKELYNAELHQTPKRPIDDIVKDYTDDGWFLEDKE